MSSERPTARPSARRGVRWRGLAVGASATVLAVGLGWLAFVQTMADRDAVDRLGFIK
ncbi:MAG: hypothetical protein AAFY88_27365 [Acidobacteriota bacterium]